MSNPHGRIYKLGFDLGVRCNWRCAFEPVCEKELSIVLADRYEIAATFSMRTLMCDLAYLLKTSYKKIGMRRKRGTYIL